MLREERRKIVLHSAKTVFSQKGYHQASVSKLIQHAGIARATFYLYFKSKRDVFNFILDELIMEVEGVIKRIKFDSSASSLEQLRSTLRLVIKLALENPEMTQIVLSRAGGLDPEFDRKLQEFYEVVLGKIESSLDRGIELGLVRKCNTKITACCILGCMKETINLALLDQDPMSQLDSVLDEILNFGLQGILTF